MGTCSGSRLHLGPWGLSLAFNISPFNVGSYIQTMDSLIKVTREKGCRVQTLDSIERSEPVASDLKTP